MNTVKLHPQPDWGTCGSCSFMKLTNNPHQTDSDARTSHPDSAENRRTVKTPSTARWNWYRLNYPLGKSWDESRQNPGGCVGNSVMHCTKPNPDRPRWGESSCSGCPTRGYYLQSSSSFRERWEGRQSIFPSPEYFGLGGGMNFNARTGLSEQI